jgi:hypothetical protein
MATQQHSTHQQQEMATATTAVPSTPNATMSNCLWGGQDEDEKDKDEGDGRDDDATTEEEDEERRTTKGRGRTREMMAQEMSLTSLGP